MKAVLCDIEGTTTSISFAHQVLFPISYERIESFVRNHRDPIPEEIQSVKNATSVSSIEEVIVVLKRWIEEDRKEGALKSIQGKIWKEAFEAGQIKGHVYPDVPIHFKKWHGLGIRIGIFSSGSVEAQKLIFRFSEAGDLTPYIDDYFDTKTGPKKESHSYQRIAEKLQLPASTILFLSDVTAELDAAAQAGMRTTLLLREGTAPPAANQHPTALTFDEIEIQD